MVEDAALTDLSIPELYEEAVAAETPHSLPQERDRERFNAVVHHLKHRVSHRPEQLPELFTYVQDEADIIHKRLLDTVLYDEFAFTHSGVDPAERRERWPGIGGDMAPHLPTSYEDIHCLVTCLDPGPEDVIYDLGSGSGRVVLYGALATDATWKGVELVEELHTIAAETADQWQVENAVFIQGNVLEQDYRDADAFYTYAPFQDELAERVDAYLAGFDAPWITREMLSTDDE